MSKKLELESPTSKRELERFVRKVKKLKGKRIRAHFKAPRQRWAIDGTVKKVTRSSVLLTNTSVVYGINKVNVPDDDWFTIRRHTFRRLHVLN